ncbi:MAG: lipopolysaccharide transport periplasmic protein LptA [Gammaproteobacteria bacterium]
MKKLKRYIVFTAKFSGLLVTAITGVYASSIAPLPIEIQSDTAVWDQKTQQAVHTGNVVMKQGDKTLKANELIIEKNDAGAIQKLIARGNPAIFDGALTENNPTSIKGHAQTIFFFPSNERLILKGDAELTQAQNIFKGPEVAFDFASKQITAQSSPSSRPTLIYQPETP